MQKELEKLAYLTKIKGIGGIIKSQPEDFIVEEITKEGEVLSIDKQYLKEDEKGLFTRFILQKKGWTTEGALRRIGDALNVGKKRFSYAGSKDKIAITTQLASAFKVEKEKLLSLQLKDIKILSAWYAAEKIKLGQLLGNHFTIKLREADVNGETNVKKIYCELNHRFPNYFGPQRFGSNRRNTHIVGEHLVNSRADLAVIEFLAGSCEREEREEARIARENLKNTNDFALALREFPKSLTLERSILHHLVKYPRDYVGALRRLPRATLLLFMHAFQSKLFNLTLSERIKEGEIKKEKGEYYCGESLGFPDISKKIEGRGKKNIYLVGKIIGYETKTNEREKEFLLKLGIKTTDFKLNFMPEISTKGSYRLLLAPLKDFSFNNGIFIFSLPAGSYATIALREFVDKKLDEKSE